MSIEQFQELDSDDFVWTHRRVLNKGRVRVREVYYEDGEPFGYCPPRYRDFLRHPRWLWSALRRPVITKWADLDEVDV